MYIHTSMKNTAEHHPTAKNLQHTYTFEGPCWKCQKNQSVTVQGQELFNFNQTGRISEFQSSSASDREILLSGTCDNCWNEIFGNDNEK